MCLLREPVTSDLWRQWSPLEECRSARHATAGRWFVDETYVKVAGRWTYLYSAIDQHRQDINVLVSERRAAAAAQAFLAAR
jgi:transposase-like protein